MFTGARRPATSFLFNSILWMALALWVMAGSAFAAPGDLIGKTLTRMPGGDNQLTRALVQPDGKIIVVGSAHFGTLQYQITRYNADGTLDTGFATNGTVLEPLGPGDGTAYAVALDAAGNVVVAGDVRSDRDRFGIARFNSAGVLDLSFGGGGSAVSIGTGDAGAYAMVIQPSDGKIILGGYSTSGGKKVFTLARYNTNDTIDTTFGTNGFAIAPAGASDEVIKAIGLQSDGKIVAAGPIAAGGTRLMRFNTNGSIDGTWPTASVSYFNNPADLVMQSDGKVAIVGGVNGGAVSEVGVLRLTATGTVDTAFGNGPCATGPCPGVAHMSISDSVAGYGLALQSGKYVVSGDTVDGAGRPGIALGRFTSTGSPDTTFGGSGSSTVVLRPTGSGDAGRGLAIRSNGGIIVAGLANGSFGDYDALTTALTADGALDTTFNQTGFAKLDVGSIAGEWKAIAMQSDGKIVAAGTSKGESHTATPAPTEGVLGRYLANGTLDTTFGTGGLVRFSWPAAAVAVQSNGAIVVAGHSPTGSNVPSMTFARYLANGTIDTTFGTNGTAVITPTVSDEEILALAIQTDGMIVGAGVQANGSFFDAIAIRLTSAGAVDPAFNGGAKQVVAMSTGADEANAVALQADGKIVLGGWAEISGTQDSMAVARLDTNGSLDASFGTGGVAVANFGTQTSKGYGLVVQPDGNIVLGGSVFNGSTDDFALARFQSSGGLDNAFGTNGMTSNDFGNHNRIFSLVRLPSGKLLGAGETGGRFAVVQYLPSGALDTTFGTNGSTAEIINTGNDYASAVALGPDGTINVLGNGGGRNEVPGVLAFARFASDVATTPPVDLEVTMTSNMSSAFTGKDVIFTITATNHGPNAGSNVTVTDAVPSGWTWVWSTPGCTPTAGTVTCPIGAMASGATATFTVVLRPANALPGTNTATIAGDDTDPNLANNSASIAMGVTQSAAGVPVVRYRLYNPISQEHLYTTDQNEYNVLGAGGVWQQEGTAGQVLNNPGSFNGVTATPYYRLYNNFTLWHHWTTDANEYYTLITFPGWGGEGVDGYLLPSNTTGATQLYRLVYPDGRGLHHWTIDATEYNILINTYGWVGEGGSGFVVQ